ncbi:hypothetical protein JCM10450v2_005453 [Rhodotorula kratochvilovae]
MESINKLVDQGKGLVDQYLHTDSSSSSTTNPSGDSHAASRAVDSLGVTGGAERLSSDRGDATFSGDIERESGDGGAEEGFAPAYAAYNASGRDATGSFDGGANDPPNFGPGEMPH